MYYCIIFKNINFIQTYFTHASKNIKYGKRTASTSNFPTGKTNINWITEIGNSSLKYDEL